MTSEPSAMREESRSAPWVCLVTRGESLELEQLLGPLFAALDGNVHVAVVAPAGSSPAGDDRVHLVDAPAGGLAEAYGAAFAFALARGAQVVVQMDAGGTHDPRDLPRLLAGLRTADVVIGSRYVAGAADQSTDARGRLLGRAGSWYARRVLSLPLADVGSGFRCFRASAAREVVAAGLSGGDYGLNVELTRRAVLAGLRTAELPVTLHRARETAAGAARDAKPAQRRVLPFLAVGLVGAATGYATLIALVEGLAWSPHLAFLVSSAVSFETNFLLNDRFTWRDRHGGASRMRRRVKFHAGRWAVYPPSQLVFSLLVLAGIGYLGATTLVVALASSVNYVVGDRWVFGRRRGRPRVKEVAAATDTPVDGELPSVSVVIPVRNSGATLKQTVASVLAQDYGGPLELILVGSAHDGSWDAVREEIASNVVTAYELDVDAPGRDTAAKRTLGFDHASGSVLCSIDSDTYLPPGWIATAVRLVQSGWDGAGGPCTSLDSDFWGEYVDRNRFGRKTPRMDAPYVFDAGTLGHRGQKLPVTGCAAFTAEVYAAVGGFDKDFVWTYDDYEFFQRVAEHGFRMICTPELVIGVHHRSRFQPLVKEYWESGAGCAQFVRKFPRSPFSVTRLRQLTLVASAAVACLVFPVYTIAGAAAGLIVLGLASVRFDGRWRAFLYPAITVILGLVFASAMAFRLVAGVVHRPQTRVGAHTRRVPDGEVVCSGACQNVVAMHDVGDDLAVDLTRAAASS